ncbi:MAG: uroporphyrinogen-III synthase [Marinilabiliaceae bacterium]|nr:uroporphyrinogen-III synthase [Marinilabiliaceae bacterium]
MKIKKILISQPAPAPESKSPYFDIAEQNGISMTFRPFIHIEGVSAKDFRKQKVDILSHSAVIFTSKTAIDHFFRLCEEMRITVPETMKYFCVSESISVYLQKYTIYRKRKVFFPPKGGAFKEMLDTCVKRHKDEKFLLLLSDISGKTMPDMMDKMKLTYTKAVLYNTVASDMTDINIHDFDIVLFFSPQGIASLQQNFPDFEQGELKIGTFGPTTAKAVKDAGLRLDIEAPTPEAPSMTMALDQYIKKNKK